MKKFVYTFSCLLFVMLLVGCSEFVSSKSVNTFSDGSSNNTTSSISTSTSTIPVASGSYEHKLQNLRTCSNGTQTITYGDHGVYQIDPSGWNLIYSGDKIMGMDITQKYIYILQLNDDQTASQIIRMDLSGENITPLQEISNTSMSLRIYNEVLYFYTQLDSAYIRTGIALTADGFLSNEIDTTSADFVYKRLNEFANGTNNTYNEAYDPGFSNMYYGGVFEYRPNDEISHQLYFVNNSNFDELQLIPSLDKVLLIAGPKIYYTEFQQDTQCKYYDIDSGKSGILFNTSNAFQIINYDEDYLYITGDPLFSTASTIQRVNLRSLSIEDVLDINLTNVNANNCFDVCTDWYLYRDPNSNNLVLQNKKDDSQILSEP